MFSCRLVTMEFILQCKEKQDACLGKTLTLNPIIRNYNFYECSEKSIPKAMRDSGDGQQNL